MVRACGPVRTIPQKTRVVFQVRVRFAGCYPRKSHLLCGFALPRRVTIPGSSGLKNTLHISSDINSASTQLKNLIRRSKDGSASHTMWARKKD
ncbi:MAG: hypothetical protein ACREBG_31245 [Pyrinomonadaceae bacterium]